MIHFNIPERQHTNSMAVRIGDYVTANSITSMGIVTELCLDGRLRVTINQPSQGRSSSSRTVYPNDLTMCIRPHELTEFFPRLKVVLVSSMGGVPTPYTIINSQTTCVMGEGCRDVTTYTLENQEGRRITKDSSYCLPLEWDGYCSALRAVNFTSTQLGYHTCESCSVYTLANTTRCHSCMRNRNVECRGCGETFDREGSTTVRYCPRCMEVSFAYCAQEGCDNTVRRNNTNIVYTEDDGDGYACRDHRQGMQVIKAWDYKPRSYPYFGKGELYFGVEWEVENRTDSNREVLASNILRKMNDFKGAKNLVFFKHDGSIENGFEIVSNPFSWEFFKKRQDVFFPIYQLLQQGMGSDDYETCGFHIHLNREAFSTLHLYKFMSFIYQQPDAMTIIAERNSGRYASYNRPDQGLARKAMGDTMDGKYVAINNSNRKTVELRIFKGSLEPKRFKKNMEFAHALWRYSRGRAIRHLNITNFMDWVQRHSKTYRNLYAFLEANHIPLSSCPVISVKKRARR